MNTNGETNRRTRWDNGRRGDRARLRGFTAGIARTVTAFTVFASMPAFLAASDRVEGESAGVALSAEIQGEYTGEVRSAENGETRRVGLQVAAYGDARFRARFFVGGLPGEAGSGIRDADAIEFRGVYEDGDLTLEGEDGLRFRFIRNRFAAVDAADRYRGHLNKTRRESPTLGRTPPEGAVVLFDGSGLDHWQNGAETDDSGLLTQGATTVEAYGDARLHVEAKLGFMPANEDQNRTNSGIYVMRRYEVQVLDSFALPPALNGNGALYNVSAPSVNVSYPPTTWQTYDIFFRAPRFDEDGSKTENARATVYLNGVLVQDDVELEGGTGAGGELPEVPRAELNLQDHGNPVRFNNVWLVEEEYAPPGTDRLAPGDL